MPTIEGALGAYFTTGAPVAAVNEVQTLTFGTGSTGGTYRLAYSGFETGNINYSTTNSTLLASLQAALDLLAPFGVNGVVATAGSLTAGVGTVLLTFSGANVAGRPVANITVTNNALTVGPTTLTNVKTTTGVAPSPRGPAKGATLVRLDTAVLHINTGTAVAPVWTVVGSQT